MKTPQVANRKKERETKEDMLMLDHYFNYAHISSKVMKGRLQVNPQLDLNVRLFLKPFSPGKYWLKITLPAMDEINFNAVIGIANHFQTMKLFLPIQSGRETILDKVQVSKIKYSNYDSVEMECIYINKK